MSVKKIMAGVFLGALFLVLAGCGNKNVSIQTPIDSDSANDTMDKGDTQADVSQKMPEATGNVDETVDAIISGATSEGAQVLSTDGEATAAVEDSQDINNLNNTYDENAL